MKWLNDFILRRAEVIRIDRAIQQEGEAQYAHRTLSSDRGLKMNMVGAQAIQKSNRADFQRDKSLNFCLHPAEGGFILEYNHYDPNHDRHAQRLHIINDSDDMGNSIAKIITMELLRR